MFKRLYFTTVAILCSLLTFAIDPHGSRVDHYDRGYSSGSGGGAGIIFVVVIIFVVYIIFRGSSSNSNKY